MSMDISMLDNKAQPGLANYNSNPQLQTEGMDDIQLHKLYAWLHDEFGKCKAARYQMEKQWYINLSFYSGRQWFSVINSSATETGYKFVGTPKPPWRVQVVINKIRVIVRTEISRLTSNRPTFTVVPKTNEDEDQAAARVASQIFEAAYYNNKILDVMTELAFWLSVTGNGFVKTFWDANKGPDGDIRVECINPFYLYFPDYINPSIDLQPYVIHATTKPREWVKQTYNIDSPATLATDDIYKRVWLGLSDNTRVIKDQVLIKEFWIKPAICPALPMGGFVTCVGDKIVQLTPGSPYSHGQFPFAHAKHVVAGQFYGHSLIEDLIDPQREYNKTISQLIEDRNMMSRPKMVAQRGSIDPNMINTEPGQVILYNPGFNPPAPIALTPIPSYVMDTLNRCAADMDDIAGMHEISRGGVPGQVTAATAIATLQEADNAKLGPVTHSIENLLEKVGTQYLKLVTQYWEEERLIQTAGEDMSFTAIYFKGNDLKGNTDIRVEAGSGLPYSKAAKQAFIMDLIKIGAVDPKSALDILDLKGIEKVISDYKISVNQAQRENIKMANGIPCMANTWDEHKIHVEIHNKFRRGEEFEALDDQMKMLFEQHVRSHEFVLNPQAAQPGQESVDLNQPQPSMPELPPMPGAEGSAEQPAPPMPGMEGGEPGAELGQQEQPPGGMQPPQAPPQQ